MAWFRNSYWCDQCEEGWTDEWSCACDDRYPVCDTEIVPHEAIDLTVLVEKDDCRKQWVVLVSPPTAEHKPQYFETHFERRQDADTFAEQEILRLGDDKFAR